ncbi:hypothetical protein RO182_003947 [Escherichia coli]|nr:hypothetical protein [Escherichia coli]EEV6546005.1 hypothetical protein [Escherichia coli]EFC1659133.1 hypothetical protein [Escherichia coli]EFN3898881.1 hypothetical protein [Escherichia coli]EFO9431598.1 hypothetical protein [Escherichia coli]
MRRVFVDKKFSILRKRVKHSQKKVMDCIIADHNADICVLCGSSDDITREHIIPQWAFESNAEKSLINKKNNQSTHYIKVTVPACRVCNSDLLGVFEYNLKKFLTEKRGDELTDYEYDCIIWWLQYMGFKLQLMDLRTRFLRYKGGDYIPFLANFPVAMFWGDVDTTPGDVFRIIRKSRRNLMSKWKDKKHNSLMVFETSNKSFHFFHKADEFIFIEIPQVNKAFFFFFNKEFDSHDLAHEECMKIIEKCYN